MHKAVLATPELSIYPFMYFSSPLEYKGTADSTGTICLVCMVEQRKGGRGRREEENWYNPAPKTLETELC